MTTKARVIFTNSSAAIVGVETNTGSVTVLDLLGGEAVHPGDILSGDIEELGMQEIYHETRGEHLMVFIHARGLSVYEAAENHFAQSTPVAENRWKNFLGWLRFTKLPRPLLKV